MGIVSSVLKALISIWTKERGRCEARRGEPWGHCVSLSRFVLSLSLPIPTPITTRLSVLWMADLWGLCRWDLLPSSWCSQWGAPTGEQRADNE